MSSHRSQLFCTLLDLHFWGDHSWTYVQCPGMHPHRNGAYGARTWTALCLIAPTVAGCWRVDRLPFVLVLARASMWQRPWLIQDHHVLDVPTRNLAAKLARVASYFVRIGAPGSCTGTKTRTN